MVASPGIHIKSLIMTGIVVFGLVVAGPIRAGLYPDIGVVSKSDNQLRIKYQPVFSEDFVDLGHGRLLPFEGKEYWGRSFLVAVPPGGDLDLSYNYSRAGEFTGSDTDAFISDNMPLVVKAGSFQSRGHTVAQIYIFPQRSENGRVVAYGNFEITLALSSPTIGVNRHPVYSRLDSVAAKTVINPDQFYDFGIKNEQSQAAKIAAEVFDPSANWMKIFTVEAGVTRVTGSSLAATGINIDGIASADLRLFYGGGEHPPFDPADPEPALHQISIEVFDGGDGVFDASDYFLFYTESLNRFEYGSGAPVYLRNNYFDKNCYWLAIGGYDGQPSLRWTQADRSVAPGAVEVLNKTIAPVRLEQELVLRENTGSVWDYYNWYWGDSYTISTSANLPDLAAGDSLDIIMAAIGSYAFTKIILNGTNMNRYYDGRQRYYDISGAGVAGLNNLRVELQPASGPTHLDYLEIYYSRYLDYRSGGTNFNSFSHNGGLQYNIGNYSSSLSTIDITDPEFPKMITGITINGSVGSFYDDITAGTISDYLVYSDGDIKNPVSMEPAQPGSLRADLEQYDCIVVAPAPFKDALQEYIDYREAQGYRIKLATVEDIYDEFGFGLESPIAIRNYLRYAYENCAAPAPYAALLAGDGNYDFLNHLGLNAPSPIPPYIWPRLNTAGDDYFVYFGQQDTLDSDGSYVPDGDRGWDMMIARWPVRSSSEVSHYIQKIRSYESPSTQGSWRSLLTFVADDEFKGQNTTEIIHTAQAESLAVYHTPIDFVPKKIYLTEYPFASNGEKPLVNDDIINTINNGTLLINYIGHGSPDVWADEHVLNKASDLGRMKNTDRLAVFIAASCSIGLFDAPDREGMAEVLFRQDGGAISVVSANRLVYSSDNARFVYDLYDCLFSQNTNICESVYATKMLHQYQNYASLIRNDRAYIVMGDPLGKLGMPEYRIAVDSLSQPMMTPLNYFGFYGEVMDSDSNRIMTNGDVEVTIHDSPIIRHHELGITYVLPGNTIYRGTVAVEDGVFQGGFIVPLDIDYGGQSARISGYASLAGKSGLGGMDSIPVAEGIGASNDETGPSIEYYFEENPDFVSGDYIPSEATLVVNCFDSSGINLTGNLGHQIELILDNDNSKTINLTEYFNYNTGDYRSGSLSYTLTDLSPQRHQFKIRVWDNANNPAEVEFEAVASRSGRIEITNLMNYPNPMEESTEFFFELSEAAESVDIQIFTLAGRKIREFHTTNPKVGRNREFYFDGRDQDGDRVATGVYIYKLTARGRVAAANESADNMAEAFGKLIILN